MHVQKSISHMPSFLRQVSSLFDYFHSNYDSIDHLSEAIKESMKNEAEGLICCMPRFSPIPKDYLSSLNAKMLILFLFIM